MFLQGAEYRWRVQYIQHGHSTAICPENYPYTVVLVLRWHDTTPAHIHELLPKHMISPGQNIASGSFRKIEGAVIISHCRQVGYV